MNKKINIKIVLLALFQLCLFATQSFAQCPNPPNCLTAPTQQVANASWQTSHSVVTYSTNNVPGSTGRSLSMWSYLGVGSGAFTCYNFMKDSTYRVCFWVRNNSGWPSNPWGRLYVYAANTLSHNGNSGPSTVPTVQKQLIDQSYYGPPQSFASSPTGEHAWQFISVTFTANDTFSNLWFYPLNPEGPPPPGPAQWNVSYVLEVDDIRVTKERPAYNFTIAESAKTTGCTGQATLTISGKAPLPAGLVASWSPPVASSNPTGLIVTARPCDTTTYTVTIYDTTSSCGTCARQVLTYTLNMPQWSSPSRIVYPPTLACAAKLILDYNIVGAPACGVTYKWIAPDGSSYAGKQPFGTGGTAANVSHSGEWTLEITNTAKGCTETHKFKIKIGSCCVSTPNFTFTGCNPVKFTNTSTGITNQVSAVWTFDDGTKSDDMNPIHTYNYTSSDTATVCLTMLYDDGQGEMCCNRKCRQVPVCAKTNGCEALANFDYSYSGGWAVTFTDGSSGSGTICNYKWEFSDGTIINTSLPNPIIHSFTTAPPWQACLTVTNCVYDDNGIEISRCTNKKCINVPAPPPTPPQKQNLGDPSLAPANTVQPLVSNSGAASGKVLTVFPNPNYGSFELNLGGRSGSYLVVLRDAQAREVYRQQHVFSNVPVKIVLKSPAEGIYSAEVSNEHERFTEQVSVSR